MRKFFENLGKKINALLQVKYRIRQIIEPHIVLTKGGCIDSQTTIEKYAVERRILGLWWYNEFKWIFGHNVFLESYDRAIEFVKVRQGKLLFTC